MYWLNVIKWHRFIHCNTHFQGEIRDVYNVRSSSSVIQASHDGTISAALQNRERRKEVKERRWVKCEKEYVKTKITSSSTLHVSKNRDSNPIANTGRVNWSREPQRYCNYWEFLSSYIGGQDFVNGTRRSVIAFTKGPHWTLHTVHTLTWWSRVLFKKLKVAQLIKKFPAPYGELRFIIVFTGAHQWTLSCAG